MAVVDHCATCRTRADEIAQLRVALQSRDIIGQAKGLLMAALHCGADEAFGVLVEQSQRMNTRVRDIACGIVERHEAAVRV